LEETLSNNSRERLIRIMNCGDSYTQNDIEVVSSCILYNFGLARLFLAREIKDDTQATTLLEGSRKILALSLATLRSQQMQCTDEVHVSLILFVSSLVLRSLEQASIELGDNADAAAHTETLVNVQQAANKMLQDYKLLWGAALSHKNASAA